MKPNEHDANQSMTRRVKTPEPARHLCRVKRTRARSPRVEGTDVRQSEQDRRDADFGIALWLYALFIAAMGVIYLVNTFL